MRRLSQREEFGVRGGISQLACAIVVPGEYRPVTNDGGPHGHFTLGTADASLLQRDGHPASISLEHLPPNHAAAIALAPIRDQSRGIVRKTARTAPRNLGDEFPSIVGRAPGRKPPFGATCVGPNTLTTPSQS